MSVDQLYIKRCLILAKNGLGTTRPNPSVGCVIVYKNKIIGEGYTSPYGQSHAEVNAINSVKDKSLLKKATLYVTLEPCSHFGKTPPCSDLIIRYNIPKVVIGTIDIHSKVAGKGVEKLKTSGCDVTVGVLKNECQELHKRFLTYHHKQRPYIILKWAQTEDGFIAPLTKVKKTPVWITNTYSQQIVHKWRTEEHAILLGTNTVQQDNPTLTARAWKGKNPIRVVIDKDQKLSKNYNIFNKNAETIIVSKNNVDFSKPLAKEITTYLHSKNIQSLIIEGGTKTLQTFIDENIWDEARVFTGKKFFKNGVKAPFLSGKLTSETLFKDDVLKTFQNIL